MRRGARCSVLGARRLLVTGLALVGLAGSLAAQLRPQQQPASNTAPAIQPEGRLDVFLASGTTIQLGGGVAYEVDRNVRLAVLGGLGSTLTDGRGAFSARLDVLGRFVLDPDRTERWALYGAGGIGIRYEASPSWRGVIIALIGLEGPVWGEVTPFFEAGWGGGVQIGFGVRRATVRGR